MYSLGSREGSLMTEQKVSDSLTNLSHRLDKVESVRKSDKDFWDKLSAGSSLITGLVIGCIGTLATLLYNQRQIDLEDRKAADQILISKMEALSKYFPHLKSPEHGDREFGYATFVALGFEDLAVKIIANRGDEAGKRTLETLSKSADKQISGQASDALRKISSVDRIKTIITVFETGRDRPDYSNVSISSDGPNNISQITYGASQTTEYGTLWDLVSSYVEQKGKYAEELAQYLNRIGSDSLVDNAAFKTLLHNAGKEDPIMAKAQEELIDKKYDEKYWSMALKYADEYRLTLPLSLAVIFDSVIHSGSPIQAKETTASLGGTPATGIDERQWIIRYLELRRDFFRNHANAILHASVRRPETFLKLAKEGNWELTPPLQIQDVALK
jgi:chitosanase